MRRCTVYNRRGWKPGDTVHFEGWLLSVDPEGTYQHCSVVDEDGRIRTPYTNQVRVHVPTRVDLMDGTPRRGIHGDGLPADEN
jgi:hypothetical protein